ncbi:MAG TPA: 5'/3'-nucleotidase SurE [bacterium]|jgi:5'-nucleotidase
MKILVTNDDGIRAPGLAALANALKDVGDVVVVAPEMQQSGVGHSITLHKALRCNPEREYPVSGVMAYSTNGTPTDAVLLGLNAVFESKPDLVISGINSGPNLGDDVTYSGTVAGAMEGTVNGVPSIAVSIGSFDSAYYSECGEFIAVLSSLIRGNELPSKMLLNINYPDLPKEKIKGVAVTRQGHRWYVDVVHERQDPRGRNYYWITGKKVQHGYDPGTDAYELDQGFISITPLSMNLTNTPILESVSKLLRSKGTGEEGVELPYPVQGPS